MNLGGNKHEGIRGEKKMTDTALIYKALRNKIIEKW